MHQRREKSDWDFGTDLIEIVIGVGCKFSRSKSGEPNKGSTMDFTVRRCGPRRALEKRAIQGINHSRQIYAAARRQDLPWFTGWQISTRN